MFNSSNFFKGFDCPYYEKGPGCCKRPYCHFRHVRKGSEPVEEDTSRQFSTALTPPPKEAVHVSYKALPSVPKSSKSSSRHRTHHQDNRRKVHLQQKCRPQTKFSYVPTPLAQLSNRKLEQDNQDESPGATNLANKQSVKGTLPDVDAAEAITSGTAQSTPCHNDPQRLTSNKTQVLENSMEYDVNGAGDKLNNRYIVGTENYQEEEGRDSVSSYVNKPETIFDTPGGVAPPTSVQTPLESATLADTGCYKDFVALQKQEISRIEAQLAELAKQKELAERSIALVHEEPYSGKDTGMTDGLVVTNAIKTPCSPPTFMPERVKSKNPHQLTYSHDASAESHSSGSDYYDKNPVEDDLEYDPLSNYSASVRNSDEIKAFIKHVRRKSTEKQMKTSMSTYEPTPVSSVVPTADDKAMNSEPEGSFSSDEEGAVAGRISGGEESGEEDDVQEEEEEEELEDKEVEESKREREDESKVGISESHKGTNKVKQLEELKSSRETANVKSKEKSNYSADRLNNTGSKMSCQDKKKRITVTKELSCDKKKVSLKEGNVKELNKTDLGGGSRKRQLSASDLSSFYQKRKIKKADESLAKNPAGEKPNSSQSIKNSVSKKSPTLDKKLTQDILSTRSDKSLVKKSQKSGISDISPGSDRVVSSDNGRSRADKMGVNKSQKSSASEKPVNTERKNVFDCASGKADKALVKKSPKLSGSQNQMHNGQNRLKISRSRSEAKAPKSTAPVKAGTLSNKYKQVSSKEDPAKRKLSQLFGDDSSEEDDAVNEMRDVFALEKQSEDIYEISSDSSGSKYAPSKTEKSLMVEKKKLNFSKNLKGSKSFEKCVQQTGRNGPNRLHHLDKKKTPQDVLFRRAMGVGETERFNNSMQDESDMSSDEVILIADDDETTVPPRKATPLSVSKSGRSSSFPGKSSTTNVSRDNPSKVLNSEKAKSVDKYPIQATNKVTGRSQSSEIKTASREESSSDEDFVAVEEFDNEDLFCDSDDLKDEDAYEECLQIFRENWNVIPQSEQKKRALKVELTKETEPKENQSETSKRQAHAPKFDTKRVRKITKREKALPSPAQICHKRFMDAQKAALERSQLTERRLQEEKRPREEKKESFVKASSKRRISHLDSHRSQNGGSNRPSGSSKSSHKQQKTLSMTASKDAKRVAHIPTKVSKRPLLPTEYGSKVSTNIRQRYLNLFIDELLKTCKTEKAAFDKALAEEREVYDRASSRSIYLNLSVNALKRLRKGTGSTQPSSHSSNNRFAVSHQAVLGGKAATLTTYTLHRNSTQVPQKFEGLVLYEKLKQYLASEEQLVENGYPRPSSEPGKAVINREEKKKPSDPNQHVCCRCGKTFLRRPNGKYITKEQCVHHWGKLWTKKVAGSLESRYSCCAGDVQASGCGVAKYHVTDEKVVNSNGFMKTMVKSPPPDGNPGVFAVDCEMCYTTLGVELTRVTVVSDKLERVYDSLVKPQNEVVDYNTKFSGITEEDLETVKTTLQNVQAVLLSMFSSETILIGHSLESDLLALKLIHSTVIDTALVFPHRRGPPYKRALRTLTAEYLQKLIQDDESGHDSMEDARSCMELMIYKLKQDAKLRHQRS